MSEIEKGHHFLDLCWWEINRGYLSKEEKLYAIKAVIAYAEKLQEENERLKLNNQECSNVKQ